MLNYEVFMEKLKESILNLSGWNAENVSFVPHEESKFGEDRLEIVCIESATHVGCDSLSTTALYHEYLNGKEIQTIADELVAQVRAKGKNNLYHAVVQIVDYKKARKRLFIATVGINDKDALEQCVYKTVGDIALTVSIKLISKGKNMIGLKVSTEILNVWGKELEEVFEDALKNSAEMFPVRYYDLLTALMAGPSYEGKDFMNNDCKEIVSDGLPEKCISTLDYNHGSVAIFYPGVADRLCKYLHTKDLYLTFPSINEVLVRPVGNGITAEILKSRISKELKNGQNQKDKLTEEIYYYDGEKRCIRMASGEGEVFPCK